MTQVFKGKELSNNLTMFLYYKQATGSTIEKDTTLVAKQQKILNDETKSDAEKEKAQEKIDATQVLTNVYYAMRCAAEGQKLDYMHTIMEVGTDDLVSKEFDDAIAALLDVKKKQQSGFLKKHLKK